MAIDRTSSLLETVSFLQLMAIDYRLVAIVLGIESDLGFVFALCGGVGGDTAVTDVLVLLKPRSFARGRFWESRLTTSEREIKIKLMIL